jgi:hypothetical protein
MHKSIIFFEFKKKMIRKFVTHTKPYGFKNNQTVSNLPNIQNIYLSNSKLTNDNLKKKSYYPNIPTNEQNKKYQKVDNHKSKSDTEYDFYLSDKMIG